MAKKSKTKKNSKTDLRKVPKDQRPKPTTGQSGELLDLPWGSMNSDERAIVEALTEMAQPARIGVIAEEAGFGKKPAGQLRVRNGVRRLVCGEWIESVDRGTYRVSTNGKKWPRVDEPAYAEAVTKLGISAKDADVFKAAQLVLAAKELGLSDTKVAKATQLTRGYVIPRLKRLKKQRKALAGNLGKTALLALANLANGNEAEV